MNVVEKGIMRALDLGCPDALAAVIREFVNSVCGYFPNQRVGVLLVGSAARGELSWHSIDDKTELFSDIEFLIGVEHLDKVKQNQIDWRAKQIAELADLGEFFHIDCTLVEWSTLARLDTKFFIFESKECGIDLCVDELAPHLPATTPINLNRKELNEILVHRLSSIVHAIPRDYFRADLPHRANQQFAMNLAKNTLDITTWLHPYESATLVAGYGNRLSSWQQADFKERELAGFFTNEDIQYLQSCLALRNVPSMSTDSRQMLQTSLGLYQRAIRYCKHMNGIDEQEPISAFRPSARLFDEYRLRSRVAQCLSITLHVRQTGFTRLARNLLGVRRGLLVQACIDLIAAASQAAGDEAMANQSLTSARQTLGRVIAFARSEEGNFQSRWFATLDLLFKYQRVTHNY